MNKRKPIPTPKSCSALLAAIQDSVQILSGKWRVQIVGCLLMGGKMRFMDLKRDVGRIAPKVLAKELHELELNEIVKRTVMDTRPITVEYELTRHGRTLETLIQAHADWGKVHRRHVFNMGQ